MNFFNSGTHTMRRMTVAGVAALALGVGTMATTTSAEAFGGHGGGHFGGGQIFRPGGGFGHGGFGHGGFGHGGFAHGGWHGGFAHRGYGRGIGYGLGGLGLGLAVGGLYGAYGAPYNYGYGYGCLRNVETAYGPQTVNVCNG